MPAKNHLSEQQRENLLKTLRENENPYIRERIFILLLMNDGKTYQQISAFLKYHICQRIHRSAAV